jgi:integrase
MTIRKQKSGRFYAVLKVGRTFVVGKTFDTKREAQGWLARERAAIAGGVDPRAGRASVRSVLPQWLDERKDVVSAKTYVSDKALLRLTPPALGAMSINAVTDREVSRALLTLTRRGLAESSVRRYRASLSSFFAWAIRERLILSNPVLPTRVPKPKGGLKTEMYPFGEEDLERIHANASSKDERLADILLIAGWTGLRWSELRAFRVRDFIEVPMPTLIVQRAAPEGVETKSTKSGRSRLVPVADRVLPLIREMAKDRDADEPLFVTTTGHRLHASAFKRTLRWSTLAEGRRIHDLRHTAACLWLARGVNPGTVQAWMGHASIATTNIYLHHLGTGADQVGLARLNTRGHNGGTNQEGESKQQQ